MIFPPLMKTGYEVRSWAGKEVQRPPFKVSYEKALYQRLDLGRYTLVLQAEQTAVRGFVLFTNGLYEVSGTEHELVLEGT